MSKITCNTVADILPLYVDEVVSDDTKLLVSEHLAKCENCRKKYENMKGTVTIPASTDVKQLKNFKDSLKKKNGISYLCGSSFNRWNNAVSALYAADDVERNYDFYSSGYIRCRCKIFLLGFSPFIFGNGCVGSGEEDVGAGGD